MAVNIFFCYAHEDEPLLSKLKSHLRPLQRQQLINVWYDRDISAGTEWEREIDKHLNTAQIILLLVSPDFMNSDYCYSIEMKKAIERHEREEARVIPIILRPVYWQGEPLGKLQALPTDAKPVLDRYWHNLDEAFFNIVVGIRSAIEELQKQKTTPQLSEQKQASQNIKQNNSSKKIIYKCSFCGKNQDEVFRLISGPAEHNQAKSNAYICDECVDLCQEIIADERKALKEKGK